MLQRLHIKNFVLIEDLTLEFTSGLNILTGETGAGKSILIGAISAILGNKVGTDKIRSGCDRAVLEGTFEISALPEIKNILDDAGLDADDELLFVKRELYASGKGRCFINATQIPVAKLKEIGEYLLVIHGQNEHVTMAKASTHRELLDSFAENQEYLGEVGQLYRELYELKEKINSSQMNEQERNRRIEYLSYAIDEIDQAALSPNEEQELRDESTLLSHSEKLFAEVNRSSELLKGDSGALSQLEQVESALSSVSDFDPDIVTELENIRTALYQLQDSASFLRGYESSIDFSPERLNEIETRLALISGLKKKYGETVAEILKFRDNSQQELDTIQNLDFEREKLKELYRKKVEETKKTALELSQRRKDKAVELQNQVMIELEDLNMQGTHFEVAIEQEISESGEIEAGGKTYMLYPHGLDQIEFMLAANKGEKMSSLRKSASGGEMSRIMLAIKKVLLSKDIVDSLIFDEIDTGISGKTAEQVGKKLKSLAKERQVFVITHLAQIAAMSDSHFVVAKQISEDRTKTSVAQLSEKEKKSEIARMLAGDNITDTTLKQAEELIAQ